ncbi:MAG TPA: polyphosphate polymerase domain-containing protein [Candidatus Eisenbacteria bacterium]|jgi:hypothetical protein
MMLSAPLRSGRLEIKYLVNRTTRTGLVRDLAAFMTPDIHAGADGSYLVRSVYLESPDYSTYHDKLAGLGVRYKLRARTYGMDLRDVRMVRLEIKSRNLYQVNKSFVDLPLDRYRVVEEAIRRRTLPTGGFLEAFPGAREFFRLLKQRSMEPKILVQYRRYALERKQGGRVRVSIDDDVLATRNLELLGPLRGARRLLDYGNAVVEFKLDGTMPFWLHKLISKYELVDRAISKFCFAVRSEARLSAIGRDAE